jgi:hypothetical protein
MATPQGDFDSLQRLLKLKRLEQPPPGYFERLRREVLTRIGEAGSEDPWWRRLLPRFEFRHALIGATSACALGIYLVGLAPGDGTDIAGSRLQLDPHPSLPELSFSLSSSLGGWTAPVLPVVDENLLLPNALPRDLPEPPKGLFAPGGPEGLLRPEFVNFSLDR